MKTLHKRRRSILALVLSVMMLCMYTISPLSYDAVTAYASDEALITLDQAQAVEDSDVPLLETYVTVMDDGTYRSDQVWFTKTVPGFEPFDKYVKLELSGPDSELFKITDLDAESWDDSGVFLIEPAGDVECGEYSFALDVYSDADGKGKFDGEPVSYNVSMTVEEYEPVHIDPGFRDGDELDFSGGTYYVGDPVEPQVFPLDISCRDEAYMDLKVSDFVKLELAGEDAKFFKIEGYNPDATVEEQQQEISISPVGELEEGDYTFMYNVYVAPKGGRQFAESPQYSVTLHLFVSEREDYAVEISTDLEDEDPITLVVPVGYDQEDAAEAGRTLYARNIGNNPIELSESDLEVSNVYYEDDQEADCRFAFDTTGITYPLTIAPGEEAALGKVMPVAGLEKGSYPGSFELWDAETDLYRRCELSLQVVKNEPSLVFEDEKVDFGVSKPNLEGYEEDDIEQYFPLLNDGIVPMVVTGAKAPDGPFMDMEAWTVETEQGLQYPNVIFPGEHGYFSFMLNDEDERLAEKGEYNGNYIITAQEVDADGYLVEDGAEITINVPVHFMISDESTDVTVDFDGVGENIVINDVPVGASLHDVCQKAILDQYGMETPQAEGYYCGGLSLKPVSAYKSEDELYADFSVMDAMTVSKEHNRLFIEWRPYLKRAEDLNLTVSAPVCGDTYDMSELEKRPDVEMSGRYSPEYRNWLTEDEDGQTVFFSGTFEGGETYTLVSEFRYDADFPYLASGDSFDQVKVTANGKNLGHLDTLSDFHVLIPVTAKHDLEKVDAVPATCTESGQKEYWACKGCGRLFEDEDGTKEIEEPVVEPATGHKWDKGSVTTAPTATTDGVMTYTCLNDPSHTKTEVIPALIPIDNAEVTGIKDAEYTGKAISQNPVVTLDGTKLTAGTDYELDYRDNTAIGTATVIIKGTGKYTGQIEKQFKITKANVARSFTLGGNKMVFNSNTYTSQRLTSLARPYQLKLTSRVDKKILLEWTDCKKLNADIDGYLVMRRVGSESAYKQYATVPATRNYYMDTGISKANTNYYYIVLGYKKVGSNIMVSSDSMSVVGIRYDSTRINPHEAPVKKATGAIAAKYGLPKLNITKITIKPGQTVQLKLTYPARSFSTWTRWRSDKSAIARVNSKGLVTGVSEGKVLISGRTPNGRDIRCEVTVKK